MHFQPLDIDQSLLHIYSYNFEALIKYLEEQVKKDRDAVNEYIELGKLYRLNGELSRAKNLHVKLKSHPKIRGKLRDTLDLELGYDSLFLKEYDEAIFYFSPLQGWFKTPAYVLLGIALAFKGKGDLKSALESLDKISARQKDENIKELIYKLNYDQFVQFKALKDYKNAQTSLDKAIGIHKKAALYLEKAELYMLENSFIKAQKVLADTALKWPHEEKIYKLYEETFFQSNNYSNLEIELKSLINKGIESEALFICLAKILIKKKKMQEAKDILEPLAEVSPKSSTQIISLLGTLGEDIFSSERMRELSQKHLNRKDV